MLKMRSMSRSKFEHAPSPFDKLKAILNDQKNQPIKSFDNPGISRNKDFDRNLYKIEKLELNKGPSKRFYAEHSRKEGI